MSSPFPERICIIDDDSDFAEFLSHYLASKGARAKAWESAESFLAADAIETFDFFVIDLGLPGLDGVDLTALIRARTQAGILIISGRMGPDAFNSALSAGADMFINKPVRFDQVYHAIATIWRRARRKLVTGGGWRILPDDSVILAPAGQKVSLSQLELKLITALARSQGDPVSRAQLVKASGMHGGPDDRNLDAAIFRLRRKIERETGEASPFRTVHGVGYQASTGIEISAEAAEE